MLTSEQLALLRAARLRGANKLGVAMALADVTQVELARGVGVKQPMVSDVVRGLYRDLPLERARAYAAFFGCAIEDLFPPRLAEDQVDAPATQEEATA